MMKNMVLITVVTMEQSTMTMAVRRVLITKKLPKKTTVQIGLTT
jgi:hypothetical protein